jgi:hypothetical protein
MYISERRGLGGSPWSSPSRAPSGILSKPPYLRYLTLDRFETNTASLTPRLTEMVDLLAQAVDLSWKSLQPISLVRLIGHTDNTGSEKHNVGLGDRRAKAVEAALQQRLTGLLRKVAIVVEPSPGETEPTADNRTQGGRDRNRRVEVFVTFGVAPSPPPPPPPPCIDPRKCITELPPGSVIQTKPPEPFTQPIPPGRRGRSFEDWLKEVLAPLPKPVAWAIRNAVIRGACAALEYWLGKTVGRLSESEKEQVRRECQAQAKKPR